MHIYIYVCMYVCICVCVCLCVRVVHKWSIHILYSSWSSWVFSFFFAEATWPSEAPTRGGLSTGHGDFFRYFQLHRWWVGLTGWFIDWWVELGCVPVGLLGYGPGVRTGPGLLMDCYPSPQPVRRWQADHQWPAAAEVQVQRAGNELWSSLENLVTWYCGTNVMAYAFTYLSIYLSMLCYAILFYSILFYSIPSFYPLFMYSSFFIYIYM